GTRNLWLRQETDGSLHLEGQDLGRQVTGFWGEGLTEYEWAWSLDREHLSALLKRLGLAPDERASGGVPIDLLEQIADRLRDLGESETEERFKEAGATFWSRLGD